MPCNYKKYPQNWLSEIRPRIMKRANNTCEVEGCDFQHNELVWSVKYKGRVTGWYRDFDEADKHPSTIESKGGKLIPNPKQIRVIITIAHLDHDECNPDVKDERLMAMCQLCHLRYDASEKYRRRNNLNQIK